MMTFGGTLTVLGVGAVGLGLLVVTYLAYRDDRRQTTARSRRHRETVERDGLRGHAAHDPASMPGHLP